MLDRSYVIPSAAVTGSARGESVYSPQATFLRALSPPTFHRLHRNWAAKPLGNIIIITVQMISGHLFAALTKIQARSFSARESRSNVAQQLRQRRVKSWEKKQSLYHCKIWLTKVKCEDDTFHLCGAVQARWRLKKIVRKGLRVLVAILE